MKRLVLRRVGDYWFLDRVDVSELKAPERVPPIDTYGLWQPKPPPDRSWVTTEDIGRPRPTRPSPMRPAEGGIGFWFSAVLGGAAFAVFIVLLVGTLP